MGKSRIAEHSMCKRGKLIQTYHPAHLMLVDSKEKPTKFPFPMTNLQEVFLLSLFTLCIHFDVVRNRRLHVNKQFLFFHDTCPPVLSPPRASVTYVKPEVEGWLSTELGGVGLFF